MFDFGIWTSWFNNLLTGCMPGWAATLIECVVIGVLVLATWPFSIFFTSVSFVHGSNAALALCVSANGDCCRFSRICSRF